MSIRITQDVDANKTYLDDWTADLSDAASVLGLGSLTITAASVTVTSPASITAQAHTTTGVTFQLDLSSVTPVPSDVVVTVDVTLSNADTDVHHHVIGVTND